MLTIRSIVWGVRDIPSAVEFWTAALDYRLREEPSSDWASLYPREGDEPRFSLMQVTSDPRTHKRHHLDLTAADQATEVDRLVALGASHVEWDYEPDADYIVLEDPDGNRFCVVQS